MLQTLKFMADPEEGVKVVCVLPGTVKSNLFVPNY